MYFYTHKTNKNEQTQLLEMCLNAFCLNWINCKFFGITFRR